MTALLEYIGLLSSLSTQILSGASGKFYCLYLQQGLDRFMNSAPKWLVPSEYVSTKYNLAVFPSGYGHRLPSSYMKYCD